MPMTQNVWVSPRGREYAVVNHTSWLEKLFHTKLPPTEDVEHEIEKNKLYDWAVRTNWLKGQIDYHRRALYVDPDPLTGDQWRWLARRGAANHLLILNTDGKELANFQPGKRKKRQQESMDPKDFIMGEPVIRFHNYGAVWGVSFFRPKRPDDMTSVKLIAYIRPKTGGGWQLEKLAHPFDKNRELQDRLLQMTWSTKEEAGWAIANELPLPKFKLPQDESIARRLSLALGAAAYVCEALDVKDFILKQPIFGFQEYGSVTGVYVTEPKPPSGSYQRKEIDKHSYGSHWNRYIAYLIQHSNGDWSVYGLAPPLENDEKYTQPLVGKRWPTLHAAANGVWQVLPRHAFESAPKSVRDWMLNLKEPRARDVEYHVCASGDDHTERTYAKFNTLEKAHRFIVSESGRWVWADRAIIKKVHKRTGTVLAQFRISPQGGLVPVNEAVDPKNFFMRQPERPACKRCGTPLVGEYCSDETCRYSDWPQYVKDEDISVFSAEEIEDMYLTARRRRLGEAVDPKEFIAGVPDAHYRIRKLVRRKTYSAQFPDPVIQEFWLRVADYAGKRELLVWTKKDLATIFTKQEAEALVLKMGGDTDIVPEVE